MQDSYLRNNALERERLRAVVAGLSSADMQRSIGHGWTVSAALAHLAFWDRHVLAWLEEWEKQEIRTAGQLNDWLEKNRRETSNDDMLPQWLAMPGDAAARDALLAAEALDNALEALDPAFAQTVCSTILSRVGNRPWVIDRATHRREHVTEIERVLDDSATS